MRFSDFASINTYYVMYCVNNIVIVVFPNRSRIYLSNVHAGIIIVCDLKLIFQSFLSFLEMEGI
jgi:hypothetical protein